MLALYLFLIFSFVESIYWLFVYVYAMCVSGGMFSIVHVWRKDDNFGGALLISYTVSGLKIVSWGSRE